VGGVKIEIDAKGLDPLDLLTKTVNMIQRAWITNNPTLQISHCHPTTEKNKRKNKINK
jgi:hypothetical protein